ncbi:MAG TPA: UDP-N-acetylmuramate dehydrogenase [Bacteroidales bacterium]|nr:UDP-N-acetylmuramate dehydrogenase [Bacteroidales bacterium]HPS17577.1 UDP-N-acetylmuramate dehydrogenase [Bacteroidales bacterium]
MIILENVSLKPYNTFGIDAEARAFAELNTLQDIQTFLNTARYKSRQKLILGGGSNILFTNDFNGVVVKINTKGIIKVKESEQNIWLNVQSGVVWNDFVNYCIENNFGGIENLALIPGNVGSCPIQNIGAYGVEVKDCIESVEVIDIKSLQMYEIPNKDCKFGYRSSIFKNELKGKIIILSVTFKLTKQHHLHLEYGAIREELSRTGISQPTLKNIAEAVCNIRNCKLPDPKDIGNSGSFFKNPSITGKEFLKLKSSYPAIPSYSQTDGTYKIPAGWLIEQCGWKGYREGDAGVHEKQALVLVNYGNASGNDILQLAKKIQTSVKEKFSIELEIEVNIIS